MMTDEQRTRLARMRELKAQEPTDADLVALVEACCEQNMPVSGIIGELRRLQYGDLRTTARRLHYFSLQTENPAVLARREQFARIGQPQ